MKTIQKISAIRNSSLAILTGKFKNRPEYNISTIEEQYIEQQSQGGNKVIMLNQFRRMIYIVLLDHKKNEAVKREWIRGKGSDVAASLNDRKKKDLVISSLLNKKETIAFVEGILLGSYQFLRHLSKPEKNTLEDIFVHAPTVDQKHLNEIAIVSDATCRARNLVNEPVNYLNAKGLADAFELMGEESGFSVEVLNKSKIKALKMGGLLAVNQGSVDEPTFTIMEYKPRGAKNKQPYILVGKGVVYDTGGLSIKPTSGMDTMKCDMAGAATVGCTLFALAKAKIPIHVIALAPSTDNRPGFNAFAPGDIITMHDGSTVEMLNSDAEGRMILADALSYAKKYKPAAAFEFSTLTGAAAAAIGHYGIVCMGTASERIKTRLKESGNNVHERLAEFPFWEEYDELLKSEIADMKNIGGPVAGAITAGRFLKKFTDYPYMHLDIAGPAFINHRDHYRTKGGTGVGVRLMFDFFKNLAG